MRRKPTPNPAGPSRGAYSEHRERQRRRILDAARELFDESGIDRVTIADIVGAAGIRPSTLYEYFANKDDVVWAILAEAIEEAARRAKPVVEAAPTALAKISAILELMADELSRDPARVRFMAQFDALYARHWPAERLLTLEARIFPRGRPPFRRLIADGIADGSLRPDLDPRLTFPAVLNAVIGAGRRLASLGNKVELEYGHPVDRLFRETVRIVLLGLRATPKAPPTRKRTS